MSDPDKPTTPSGPATTAGMTPGMTPEDAARSERPPDRAGHGYRNEVSWRSGQGRQPYTNQEPAMPENPAAAGEFEQGDRGIHSGVTQEQMDQVRGTP